MYKGRLNQRDRCWSEGRTRQFVSSFVVCRRDDEGGRIVIRLGARIRPLHAALRSHRQHAYYNPGGRKEGYTQSAQLRSPHPVTRCQRGGRRLVSDVGKELEVTQKLLPTENPRQSQSRFSVLLLICFGLQQRVVVRLRFGAPASQPYRLWLVA